MNLKEKIRLNLSSALKENRLLEVLVLRQLLAALLNKEKEKRYRLKESQEAELTDEEIVEVISSEAKKRREAIEGFEKGKRKDLADKEKEELEILERYLPEQMSEEEIKKLAEESVKKTGAKELKDIGRVMQELMPEIKGRADGSLVSKIVKELLNQL